MVDVFIPRWRACARRTDALIESIHGVDESFRPLRTYRSIQEQVAHIFAARMSIVRGLRTGDFGWREEIDRVLSLPPDERLRTARASGEEIEKMLEEVDEQWLGEAARELPRSEWLWALLEHETHHAGQLSMMIRLAGGEPAQIFD